MKEGPEGESTDNAGLRGDESEEEETSGVEMVGGSQVDPHTENFALTEKTG